MLHLMPAAARDIATECASCTLPHGTPCLAVVSASPPLAAAAAAVAALAAEAHGADAASLPYGL
jgi:hypothetical protein